MRLVSARWFQLALGLTLVCLTARETLSAPANPTNKNATTSAEKIRKDLDKAIDFETTDQPLHLALKQLTEQTSINFVLDRQTLAQMNIDPDITPVQVKLKETKTKTVLRTLLSAHNLSYAIVGDIVFVSTDEMAMFRQMQQRVTIDLDKIEFSTALRQLSRETATNLIVDSRVGKEAGQTVSLQAEDVPLETAVRLMAEMVGLKPVRVGNVLFVCSKANAQELRADPDLVTRPQPTPNPNPMGEVVPVPPVPKPLVPPPAPNPQPAVPPAPAEKPMVEDKDKPATLPAKPER